MTAAPANARVPDLERGARNPSLRTVARLARALDVEAGERLRRPQAL
jgi:transcriptional regulator with XRE-family HTH domain